MPRVHAPMLDALRALLRSLADGTPPGDALRALEGASPRDVAAAAREALAALDAGTGRDARVARVRARHPHAFEPWTAEDDRLLAEEWRMGAPVAALSRAFGRPPGAIRLRLQRLGHDPRRRRAA